MHNSTFECINSPLPSKVQKTSGKPGVETYDSQALISIKITIRTSFSCRCKFHRATCNQVPEQKGTT